MSDLPPLRKEAPPDASRPHLRWWRIPLYGVAVVAVGYLLHWPVFALWTHWGPAYVRRIWIVLGITSLLIPFGLTWDHHR